MMILDLNKNSKCSLEKLFLCCNKKFLQKLKMIYFQIRKLLILAKWLLKKISQKKILGQLKIKHKFMIMMN